MRRTIVVKFPVDVEKQWRSRYWQGCPHWSGARSTRLDEMRAQMADEIQLRLERSGRFLPSAFPDLDGSVFVVTMSPNASDSVLVTHRWCVMHAVGPGSSSGCGCTRLRAVSTGARRPHVGRFWHVDRCYELGAE